jgi:hypothetical protein
LPARIEKAAGDLQRPAGLKIAYFQNAPPAPVFADLHWRAKGANQNCCSIKGTKKLLRRGHKIAPRAIIFSSPSAELYKAESALIVRSGADKEDQAAA